MKDKIGDDLRARNSAWTFKGSVAKNFQNHISRSIPFYTQGQELVTQVSDFFIKRPWDKVFSFKAEELLQMIENKGYVDVSFINEIIDTFLTAKNVSTDITFLELINNNNVRYVNFPFIELIKIDFMIP